MIGHDQNVLVSGIGAGCPGDKIDQGLGLAHIDLAEILDQFGANAVEVVIVGDQVAAGGVPVAIAAETTAVAVKLAYDDDLVGRADHFSFVEVNEDVPFQGIVIRVLVEHDQPGFSGVGGGNRGWPAGGCRGLRLGVGSVLCGLIGIAALHGRE